MFSIIVPTLGRAHAIGPLIDSIRQTTPLGAYEVVFVLDSDDELTKAALLAFAGSDVVSVIEPGSYPHKTNAGYRKSIGDKLVPTADDVKFHPWWSDHVNDAFDDPSVCVVGTNDLSPATENGDHATMPVIRRDYIEEPGCVWDEPGVIFHEGYHHNFVETEVWQLARKRGVAEFQSRAIIEHLHPDWGKRGIDDTDYRGNKARWDHDAQLFAERLAQWT